MNKTLLALMISLSALTLVACGDKDDSGDDDSGHEHDDSGDHDHGDE